MILIPHHTEATIEDITWVQHTLMWLKLFLSLDCRIKSSVKTEKKIVTTHSQADTASMVLTSPITN